MPGVDVIGQSSAAEGRAFGNLSGISNENIFGKMLRAPLRLIPRTAVVRILPDPLRGKKWIVGSSNRGCWLGSFEYQKQRLFARLVRPGDVFYDVGANGGFTRCFPPFSAASMGTCTPSSRSREIFWT